MTAGKRSIADLVRGLSSLAELEIDTEEASWNDNELCALAEFPNLVPPLHACILETPTQSILLML